MVYSAFICGVSCILFVFSLVRVATVKGWMKEQIKVLDKKKNELDELIYSAGDMVNELNKVSDYVVTTIDMKNNEVQDTLGIVEARLLECKTLFSQPAKNKVVEFPKENIKVIHSKKEKIEEMSKNGVLIDDIAKELGMGKGEIQLILGMTERYLQVAN